MDIDGDGRLDMDEVGMGVIEAAKEAKQAALNQAMLVKKVWTMESLHFICPVDSNQRFIATV